MMPIARAGGSRSPVDETSTGKAAVISTFSVSERHAELAAPAVRGHEDQVAAARVRRFDDGRSRLVAHFV